MNPRDIAQAIVYPATNGVIILAVAVFWGLLALAGMAGILGLWLLIAVVPAIARFQMIILDARAKGRDPEPPGIEFFSLVGEGWQLFPAVHMLLIAGGSYFIGEAFGLVGVLIFCGLVAYILPASLITLAITRSPLECLNPRSILGVSERMGASYLVLPTFLVVSTLVLTWLADVGGSWIIPLEIFVSFAFMSLAGVLAEPFDFYEEVDIHEPLEPTAESVAADLDGERVKTLNHAYGFVSRDNRTGGLEHIYRWLRAEDPNPAEGWPWFFENMLRWERNEAALYFAQQYIKRLLIDGQQVAAVKLIMRCRLINDAFKPLAEDLPRAIEAARTCNNEELAAVLERQ